jgi:hypothetical protein
LIPFVGFDSIVISSYLAICSLVSIPFVDLDSIRDLPIPFVGELGLIQQITQPTEFVGTVREPIGDRVDTAPGSGGMVGYFPMCGEPDAEDF